MATASKVQEILAAAKERRQRAETLVVQSKRPTEAPSGHCVVPGSIEGDQFVNCKNISIYKSTIRVCVGGSSPVLRANSSKQGSASIC